MGYPANAVVRFQDKVRMNDPDTNDIDELTWVQQGALPQGTDFLAWTMQPRNPGKARFGAGMLSFLANGITDSVLTIAYNPLGLDAAEPSAGFNIEEDWSPAPGVHTFEMYWQVNTAGGVNEVRPFFTQVDRTSLKTTSAIQIGPIATGSSVTIQDNTGLINYVIVTDSILGLPQNNFPIEGNTSTHVTKNIAVIDTTDILQVGDATIPTNVNGSYTAIPSSSLIGLAGFGGLWLGNAIPAADNPVLTGNNAEVYWNAGAGVGLNVTQGLSSYLAQFVATSLKLGEVAFGSGNGVIVDWSVGAAPKFLSGVNANSLEIGTQKVGAVTTIVAGAEIPTLVCSALTVDTTVGMSCTTQRTENVNYTVDSASPDQLIRSQTAGSIFTLVDVTLNDGRILTFKDLSGGAGTVFTLRPQPGQTINQVAGDFAFTLSKGAITIRGDGGSFNWDIVSETAPSAVAPPSPVQTFDRTEYWGGQTDGATTIVGQMNCFLGRAGGSNIPQPTATSLLTQTKRAGFTIGGGGGGTTMGVFDGTGLLTVWRGNAPGFGGFNLRLRFAFELASTGALHRMFAGLISQSGSSGAQDWTTQLGIATIGVGFTQTPAPNFTGNWNLIHSVGDGVTPPTVANLGASMPINITDLYQLDLTAEPNDAFINFTLTNLSTGVSITAPVNSNFPAPNKFLAMWCANACGAGGTGGQFDVIEYAFQSNF